MKHAKLTVRLMLVAPMLLATACLHDGGTATADKDGPMCVDLCATVGKPPYTESDAMCLSDQMVLWLDATERKIDELCP